MTTELEKLVVRFQGDVKDLLGAFKQANAGSTTFAKTVEKNNDIAERSLKELKAIGTVAYLELGRLAINAGRQTAAFVKSALEAADAIGDNAAAVGLSTDAYQRLSQAVSFSDISQDQFDAGMRRLTDTVGDALSGVSSAEEKFVKLGIALRDGNGHVKTQDQLLDDVISSLGTFGSEAERAAAATDLFGKGVGPKFAAFASQGREAVERLKSESVVFTDTQIQLASKVNDEWDKFYRTLDIKIKGAILNLIGVTSEFLTRDLTSLRTELGSLDKQVEDIEARKRARSGGFLLNAVDDAELRSVSERRAKVKAQIDAVTAAQELAQGERDQAAYNSMLERFDKEAAETEVEIRKDAAEKRKQTAEKSAREQAAADKKAQAEVLQALEENARRREEIEDAIVRNQQERLAALAEATDFRRARENEDKEAADQEAEERLEGQLEMARDLGTELTRAFTDAASAGENAFDRMGKSLLKFVQQIIVQEAVTRPLQGFLGGLFSGKGSADVRGSGAGAAARGALGGIFGGIFGGGRAAGGPVDAGTMYEVNERGREFFKPAVPGRVLPLSEAAASGGSAAPQINVVVQNNASGTRATAAPDGSGGLRVLVEEVVADSARRNGTAARALRSANGGSRPPLSGKE